MKVLYFHQHFSTPKGSTAIRSYSMAQQLLREGHEVTMVCGSYGGGVTGLTQPFRLGKRRGVVDGIEVVEFNLAYSNAHGFIMRSILFLIYALRSVWVALREDCDVVFATSTPLTACVPGIAARWLRGKPFVFEVRDLWPEVPKAMGVIRNPIILMLMGALEWVAYRSATRLIGLSPGMVEGIARHRIPADRITMIPNGCDIEIFADRSTPWRPEGVSDQDFMAIFTGTHGMANGLDAALDAAAELKRRGRTDIKLVLMGQGGLKAALQARAKREDLTNVVFHDPVPKHKLAGLMASADLGMQLLANVPEFYYGTSPNKFFDYISAGLPVLINYPGWLAGVVEERGCGFAVRPDDPQAFADALEKAADARASLPAMGARGLELAKEQFDRRELSRKFSAWVIGAAKA